MIRKKGFTLIELLVVIAIIALLLSIIMPSLRAAKQHAERLTCASRQRSIGMAFLNYAQENNNRSHWGPNYGQWYISGISGEMLSPNDNTRAYWGIAYYRYLETKEVFNCPSARRVSDWYQPELQYLYQWSHYGLNGFVANRIVSNIRMPSEVIVAHDHIEQFFENNGDTLAIRPGETVNLTQWRFDYRQHYPEGVSEVWRHNRRTFSLEQETPHDPAGSGYSNVIWLDGHVSTLQQSRGEDVPMRWITAGLGDGSRSRGTSPTQAPE